MICFARAYMYLFFPDASLLLNDQGQKHFTAEGAKDAK